MIPQERLSSVPQPADYCAPDDIDPPNALTDYELGGPALNDATGGLQDRISTLHAEGTTGNVYLSAPGVFRTLLFTAPGITEASLAFDQNMRPFVAFVQGGRAKFRWYDTEIEANRISDLGDGDHSPRCTMDDKRTSATELGQNDVILAYVRAGNLYYRQQRDRFEVERLLHEGVPGRFMRVGMHKGGRLQFLFIE